MTRPIAWIVGAALLVVAGLGTPAILWFGQGNERTLYSELALREWACLALAALFPLLVYDCHRRLLQGRIICLFGLYEKKRVRLDLNKNQSVDIQRISSVWLSHLVVVEVPCQKAYFSV